jgi:ArsR family transcriptional regulator
MKNYSYSKFFLNFANKTKLGIILSLKEKSMSVNELSKEIGGEQSNVSHHLKNLLGCSIVSSRKKGKKKIYSLNASTVKPMLKLVEIHAKKNCCDNCDEACRRCLDG